MKMKKQPPQKSKASEPPTQRRMKPAGEPGKNSSAELVVVYTSNGPLAAEVAKSKLASEGIKAILKSEAQSAFALTVDGMGKVQVLVRAEDEKKAQRILKTT